VNVAFENISWNGSSSPYLLQSSHCVLLLINYCGLSEYITSTDSIVCSCSASESNS